MIFQKQGGLQQNQKDRSDPSGYPRWGKPEATSDILPQRRGDAEIRAGAKGDGLTRSHEEREVKGSCGEPLRGFA